MSNNKKWYIVMVYTLLIFATIPWARQAWNLFPKNSGLFVIFFVYLGSITFVYTRFKNVFLIIAVSIIAILAFRYINPAIVRIHIIEYGILGWLCYWAGGWKGFFYVLCIAIGDEVFQKFIPGRFYDVNDMFLNICGGGIGFFLGWYERRT